MVLVLTIANTVSFIHRQILSLLVEPMGAGLGLSDTQVSLLHGLSFKPYRRTADGVRALTSVSA